MSERHASGRVVKSVSRRQQSFVFRSWGGRRKGARRKRRAARRKVPHVRRPDVDGRTPVHVTLRFVRGVGELRRRDRYRVVRRALAHAAVRRNFRICHYSLQGNHLHLVVEPTDRVALSRGMISFKTSCARRLNRLAGRRGAAFADRYHARYLATPAHVRAALSYVLNNWRRHEEDRHHPRWRTDRYSSADLFDGWREGRADWRRPPERRAVAPARFWLLTDGWRRRGTISMYEVPGLRTTGETFAGARD
jgi:REP element-mobilizing transposase RayT